MSRSRDTAAPLAATSLNFCPDFMTTKRPSTRSASRDSRASRSTGGDLPAPEPIVIEQVTPVVDAGRYAPKRVIGERCDVSAAIFRDGHDILGARVRFRAPGEDGWRVSPMTYDFASDQWTGAFALDRIGRWEFTVDAWTDVFATWRRGTTAKVGADQDVRLELLEAAEQLDQIARRMRFSAERSRLMNTATRLRDETLPSADRVAIALDDDLARLVETHAVPRDLTSARQLFPVRVDRERAAFASWYELFPRSTAPEPGRHGTFRDAEEALPRLAELGFDVVYLPPIHPIGRQFRKGPNNTLTPGPDDVGSPWAIGSAEGGHTAVHPDLGTIDGFDRFVSRANALGMEIALDFALQCAPDHPWVTEHPDWFTIRPDGSIMYAENPPKKYQDIVPINFWTDDREALWAACRDAILYWVEHGVKTFRVDNPHTKPFQFWEWAIAEVQARHPDVVFFSEAFTRPNKLLGLAKLGFTQSYTYFTWKNTTEELRQFLTEFSTPEVLEYYRGNLFANTPDILHEFLQHGGRGAFRLRLLLAGTLSPLYGIYSGYELSENVAVRPGSEEYFDSEKYQLRQRDYTAAGNLDPDIRRLNAIRRAQPALQRADNLQFQLSENPEVLWFTKRAPDGADDLLIAVNLDPHTAQTTMVHTPPDLLGLDPQQPYDVEDLLTGARYTWRGARNYIRLDPAIEPGHVFRIVR